MSQGRLLSGPGVASERLVDLDARLEEFTKLRDKAQRALDAAVAQAEALLAGQPVAD